MRSYSLLYRQHWQNLEVIMKIMNVFLGVDLRNGHDGLMKVSKDKKVDLNKLDNGEIAIFINSSKNKMKVYHFSKAITYIRFEDSNRTIDLNCIKEFSTSFKSDGTLEYEKALEKRFEKLNILNKKYKKIEVL